MNRDQVRATALGFLGVFAVLGILVYLVGAEGFIQELADANRRIVALIVVVTLGWLAAWGIGLRTVLAVMGIEISFLRSFFILNGAMFSNNVTPFGQAGGEPVTALLISKVTDSEYEQGLAAIASVDTLNFIPSVTFALVGAGYFATKTSFGRRLQFLVAGIIILAIVASTVGYLSWRRRTRVQSWIVRILTPGLKRLGGILPRMQSPTRQAIRSRVRHFVVAIERVAGDRRGIIVALAASTAGWILQMVALWLAFVAIGSPIPFSVLLFVIPVGALAAVTPLPGGAGGIEAVLVGVLTTLPELAIGGGTAFAAVAIFRGAVYWVPVTIGGVVMGVVGVDAV
ncbi:hypothetical protein C475_22064 [Halosimplex carlsbadense 2-9-1]|uniref:Uncharacterized protein n=1 Tax=Halosimplex carlsbadense 2-9-1 TaxID=797114 RepID=M0C8T3_9EURY|nr:lysylphosphatidylglycerol synthase transmembrane domain-containing protein [Halosimplex carlsbadense]ELZ19676.1 hypothetical protein C475_22064 [Halosimplex carlsbadense 2-9-1]